MNSDDDYLAAARKRLGNRPRRQPLVDNSIHANRSLVTRGAELGDILEVVADAVREKAQLDREISTIARRITALYGPWRQQKAGVRCEIKDNNYDEGEVW